MKRILLLGGTGFVGQSVCERLVEHGAGAGTRITVPTRRLARAKSVQFLPTVDPIECDVHDDAQLARVVAGHDAVVNLIAILHGSADEFERVHVRLPQRLAAACAETGVRRVIHVSALGVGADAPSQYLRSKAAGEAALKTPSLDLTVLRPSVIFGARDRFLNLFASLQALFPLVPLAGVSAQFQPVWVEDVSEAIVRCLDDPSTVGQIYECAGPRVYTLRELVQLAGRVSGHERPVIGTAAERRPAAGAGHGTAARRAADVARQHRVDARAQCRDRAVPRTRRAGHRARFAGVDRSDLSGPTRGRVPARSLARAAPRGPDCGASDLGALHESADHHRQQAQQQAAAERHVPVPAAQPEAEVARQPAQADAHQPAPSGR